MNWDDDHDRERLSAELDGALEPAERAALEASLATRPELAKERDQWQRLAGVLESSRVAVEEDFQARVMEALPAAGWESRHPYSWRWAVALLLALGLSSAALIGTGSAQAAPGGAALSAARAVFDLFATSAVAGAGLLAASWKGLGLALNEALQSTSSLVGFGVFVLFLNLLFFSLLRGKRRAATETARTDRSSRD